MSRRRTLDPPWSVQGVVDADPLRAGLDAGGDLEGGPPDEARQQRALPLLYLPSTLTTDTGESMEPSISRASRDTSSVPSRGAPGSG